MMDRNRIVANRLLFENNNNTSCGHDVRIKFKKRLKDIDSKQDQPPLHPHPSNHLHRKKCTTNFDPIPSLAQLRKQLPIPSPKVYSQIFLGKIFDIQKSTFAMRKEGKEDGDSRNGSPRSIKQTLQEKIMENVKRHKKHEKLPRIAKPVVGERSAEKYRTEGREGSQEKFVIWEKVQRGELVKVSESSPAHSLATNRPKRTEREDSVSVRKREKYAYFKDFTPWYEKPNNVDELS